MREIRRRERQAIQQRNDTMKPPEPPKSTAQTAEQRAGELFGPERDGQNSKGVRSLVKKQPPYPSTGV
jgi:hypothetical protein